MNVRYKNSFILDITTSHNIFLFSLEKSNLELIWTKGNLQNLIGTDPIAEGIGLIDFLIENCHVKDKLVVTECFSMIKSANNTCYSGFFRIKHIGGHWVWLYSRIRWLRPNQLIVGMIMEVTDDFIKLHKAAFWQLENNDFQEFNRARKLTNREVSIIRLIAAGNSYTQIAKQLNIQPDTVNRHRKNIFEKLEIHKIASLVCYAKDAGLI